MSTVRLKTLMAAGLVCLVVAACGPQRKIVVAVPPEDGAAQSQTQSAAARQPAAKPGPSTASVTPQPMPTDKAQVMRPLSGSGQPVWNSARSVQTGSTTSVVRPYVQSSGSTQQGATATGTQLASAQPTAASDAAQDPAQTPVPRDWRKHLTSIDDGGIVISIDDRRLLYWGPGGAEFHEFPVAVARSPELTRMGRTTVARKKVGPDWRPTPSMLQRDPKLPKYVPPGPNNPLGEYALYLDWRYYAIHGTNNPNSIGTRATSGCFRLYPKDIAYLFPKVDTGTPVVVVSKL